MGIDGLKQQGIEDWLLPSLSLEIESLRCCQDPTVGMAQILVPFANQRQL